MTILVPKYPPDFRTSTAGTTSGNEIRAAHPVRSDTWWQMADAVNYLHGRGGQLLSLNPYQSNITPGNSGTFSGYIWPRYENQHRMWVVTLVAINPAKLSFGTISNGTVTSDWSVGGSLGGSSNYPIKIVRLQEEVTPSATPAASNTLTVANNSASAGTDGVRVLAVQLFELPRYELDAGYGVAQHALASRNPIVGTTSGDISIEAVPRHARTAKTVARRNLLFNWNYPLGISSTSGSFANMFAFEPELRCRHLEQANTTRSVAWTAYTSVASGDTGELKLTASQSGQTDTMTFTNTSAAWQTPRTLTINTEDPTRWLTDSGLRGGSAETVQAALRRSAGSGAGVNVYAIMIGEST